MVIGTKLKNAVNYHVGNLLMAKEEQNQKMKRTCALFSKPIQIVMIACVILSITAVPVFASSTGVDAQNLLNQMVSIVVSMFRWIGFMLLIWGICQFVLAVKRTDAESKSDAIQTIICAIALIAVKTFVDSLGLGLTVDDTMFE